MYEDVKPSRRERRMLRQIENDARAVLAHPPTLRFLCRILNDCGYYEDPFAGNSNATFKRLGEQEGARKIVRALEAVDDRAMLTLLETAANTRERVASGDTEEASDDD